MDWTSFEAALFDLDGVVTPTAQVHMSAWSEVFNEYLTSRGIDKPYSDDDYFAFVDGRPRYDGVASFLVSRGIELPRGTADDAPEQETVCGIGNRKNVAFNQVLERDGVRPYPGSVALLDHLDMLKMPMAIVSSSKNAPAVLRAAGLADRFGIVVHGGLAQEKGLPGKPAPDTFLYAGQYLGAPAGGCVVLEDAESGVAAGRAGSFGLVIGVDRGAGPDRLTKAGADVVVQDLAELVP